MSEHSIEPQGEAPLVAHGNKDARELELVELLESLAAAGAPELIMEHIAPYGDSDAPYIYTGRGPYEVVNGSGGQASDGSESRLISNLVVATNCPIGEIMAERYDDQSPGVVAQWRSRKYFLKPGFPIKTTRDELEQVGENTYILREYRDVSDMGVFDGRLMSITLLVPSEKFHPQSNYPGRMSWRHLRYYRTEEGFRADSMHVSGATLLNGVQELRSLDLAELHPLKTPVGALPSVVVPEIVSDETAAQFAKVPRREKLYETAELAAAEYPEIMDRVSVFMDELAPYALKSLGHSSVKHGAFAMFTDGILRHPDKISILGRTLETLEPSARFEIAQLLIRGGVSKFKTWFDENFSKVNTDMQEVLQSTVFDRVRTLNLMQFAEAWDRFTKGAFDRPDYPAIKRDIARIAAGDPEGFHGNMLTRKIFEGLQTATVAIFVEDFLMSQPAVVKALLSK